MVYAAKRNKTRCPTHPGALLRDDIIPATGRTKAEIAGLLGISRQHLYDILKERKPVSPTVAVRLGKLFGKRHAGGRLEDDEGGAFEFELQDAAGGGVVEQARQAEAFDDAVTAGGVGQGGAEGAVLDLGAVEAGAEGDAVAAGSDLGDEFDLPAHAQPRAGGCRPVHPTEVA